MGEKDNKNLENKYMVIEIFKKINGQVNPRAGQS